MRSGEKSLLLFARKTVFLLKYDQQVDKKLTVRLYVFQSLSIDD